MEKNSQSFQLKKIIRQSVITVAAGAVLLLLSIGTSILILMQYQVWAGKNRVSVIF